MPTFTAAEIATSLGVSKKTIHRRAVEEGWPVVQSRNRFMYDPPADVAQHCIPDLMDDVLSAPSDPSSSPSPAPVRLTDIHDPTQSERVRWREAAVLEYLRTRSNSGAERALAGAVAKSLTDHPGMSISVRSLRRWAAAYEALGIDGLVEQKLGRSGRKGVAVPDDIRRRGQALVVGHGSVARAARQLALDPDLPREMREHMHEGHASKSHVTGSIRQALRVAPLTKARIQGPRAADLAGRFTPLDWSNVEPNEVWCSDDMTSNVIAWVETPHAPGYRLGQPQILPILDCGTLRWLTVHVILRESGQYTGDDIFGLFGDTFDRFGLPRHMILEGGHWQSKGVIGHRTGISDEDRIGGLASLGVNVIRSHSPRNKPIEMMFNQLQYSTDNCIGFVGRAQRTDLPEAVKKQIALVKSGRHHPKEFFLHVSQLADHYQQVMGNLNHERQDGQMLRGQSPLEAWAATAPAARLVPDSAKWMYRSAICVAKVTRNGVRVTLGSGAAMMVYYYDAPELLIPLQGRKVITYWNHSNPDADAVICDSQTRKYLGIAKRVKDMARFNPEPADVEAEKARKKAANLYVRTEQRAIQEHLQRNATPLPFTGVETASEAGQAIAQAVAAAEARQDDQRSTAREINRAARSTTREDLAAAFATDAPNRNEQFSAEEIAALLQADSDTEGENPF